MVYIFQVTRNSPKSDVQCIDGTPSWRQSARHRKCHSGSPGKRKQAWKVEETEHGHPPSETRSAPDAEALSGSARRIALACAISQGAGVLRRCRPIQPGQA